MAAAEREDARRFIVRADEILTAFLELQRAIHEFAVSLTSWWPRRSVRADEKLTAFVELESTILRSRLFQLTGWRSFCQTRRR
jgi:hypothetical protein